MTDAAAPAGRVEVLTVGGIGEVAAGADLAALLAERTTGLLADGDVVAVTSKVVAKAEGRTRAGGRAEAVAAETDRVVARRGDTVIARTHHGLVLAAAGVDSSNTAAGTVVLLPADPDASARALRERLVALTAHNVAVVVTDTAGRAWRTGQTDLAVGAAGLPPLVDLAGHADPYGNVLSVTAPAVADEVAAAADLVKGKLEGRPVAVVRGLGHLVLPVGEHGPGAAGLVRDERLDLFGLGARDAVLAAVTARPGTVPRGFGAPVAPAEAAAVLGPLAGAAAPAVVEADAVVVPLPDLPPRELGRREARVLAAAVALGWVADAREDGEGDGGRLRLRPLLP